MLKQSGFTLIEALVTIAVAGVLLGIGIPSYQTWVGNSQIRAASDSVLSGIHLARQEAASKNTPVAFNLNGKSWSVDVIANPTFNIAAKTLESGKLPGNVLIASNSNSIVFNGIGQTSPLLPADVVFAVSKPANGCIAQGKSDGLRCMNVIVHAGGMVKMCDPAQLAANNPQGC